MKEFKIKRAYIGTKYCGSKMIELNEETSQKDLNFIWTETKEQFQGIFEIPKPEPEKKKRTSK